jgi:ATPase subunit of ABC transporter with duplicated ATPase domains
MWMTILKYILKIATNFTSWLSNKARINNQAQQEAQQEEEKQDKEENDVQHIEANANKDHQNDPNDSAFDQSFERKDK